MARRNQILGLDLGHSTVKAVVASGDTPRRVERTAVLKLPAGEFDRRSMVTRWIKENNFTGMRAAVTVSGQQAMFQPMFMVPGDPRTIEQAAAMEMVKLREIADDEMTYGFAPFGGGVGERRVLLTMVRPDVLEAVLTFVREVGLQIDDVVPAPVALFNAMVPRAGSDPTPQVFVHIGHSVTELAIGSPDGLMFARAFAGGGQLFTEVLARARQVPVPHAENAKVTGETTLTAGEPALVAALTRAADMWIAEFQSCMAVYNSLFAQRRDRPQRMVLTGGGSMLGGLAAYIQQKTGLSVVADAPFRVEGSFEPRAVWPLAASLAGLAPSERTCPITVLPQRLRDEQVFRRQKPFWIAAAATAALILGVSLATGFYDNQRMARQLQDQRASLERRKGLVAGIEDTKQRTEAIRELAAPVVNLLRTGPTMRRLISLTAESKDPGDWITLVTDEESYYAKRPSDALLGEGDDTSGRRRQPGPAVVFDSPTNRAPIIRGVIIEGYTRKQSFSSVQKLIDQLNKADFVEKADLLSDDKLVQPERQEDRAHDTRSKRFVISVKVATL